MTSSMTAFARQQIEGDGGTLTWELRSVNHRYLEISLRLPENLRGLENAARERLRKRLRRGKVECQLRFHPGSASKRDLQLDEDMVRNVQAALQRIAELTERQADARAMDILRWPGVVQEQEEDSDTLHGQALALLAAALDDLVAHRDREGAALKAMLETRIESIRGIVAAVRDKLPDILKAQRQALAGRLEEFKAELDPSRLEQEVTLLAQKADVAEELDRLDAHLDECNRVLGTRDAVGRRLDFLMQELNREANTLSSKSIVAETTLDAVELKVLIEQMREQIQNIE